MREDAHAWSYAVRGVDRLKTAVIVGCLSFLAATTACRQPAAPQTMQAATQGPPTAQKEPEVGLAPLTVVFRHPALCRPSALGSIIASLSELEGDVADGLDARVQTQGQGSCAVALLPDLRNFVALLPAARSVADSPDDPRRLDVRAVGPMVLIGQGRAFEALARADEPGVWAGFSEVDATLADALVVGVGRLRTDEPAPAVVTPPRVHEFLFAIEPARVVLELRGEAEMVEAVEADIRWLFETLAAMTTQERLDAIAAGDPIAALLIGKGLLAAFSNHGLEVEKEGGRLTIALALDSLDPTKAALLAGMVAAIAAPTVIKTHRKWQTAEPRIALEKMFDGIVASMFTDPEQPRTFTGCPFPGSGHIGMTPPLSVHCAQGPAGRCTSGEGPGTYAAQQWNESRWSTLGFAMRNAHRFHYDFRWGYSAEHKGCQFTAQAFGDLDDDGVFSTFERAGAADRVGVNAAGLYIDREVE